RFRRCARTRKLDHAGAWWRRSDDDRNVACEYVTRSRAAGRLADGHLLRSDVPRIGAVEPAHDVAVDVGVDVGCVGHMIAVCMDPVAGIAGVGVRMIVTRVIPEQMLCFRMAAEKMLRDHAAK